MTNTIRHATLEDAHTIAAIYSYYIANTSFTFDTVLPTPSAMRKRMIDCAIVAPWFVAEHEGYVIGYAHAGKHRVKKAYDWSADVTIYIDHRHHRSGIASKLYQKLLESLQTLGYHTAYAGITLPNDPSVGFHEHLGFSHVGTYQEVGYKFGAWQNVGWWEKKLSSAASPAVPVRISPVDLTAKHFGPFTMSHDTQRMDANEIHRMLLKTHWGQHRSHETIQTLLANSLCFGVFANKPSHDHQHDQRKAHQEQIGFARVITDYCTFAYLADVVVREDHRRKGISKWMMTEIMAYPELQNLRRFILASRDAQSLYTKFGFKRLDTEEQNRFMGLERNDLV